MNGELPRPIFWRRFSEGGLSVFWQGAFRFCLNGALACGETCNLELQLKHQLESACCQAGWWGAHCVATVQYVTRYALWLRVDVTLSSQLLSNQFLYYILYFAIQDFIETQKSP